MPQPSRNRARSALSNTSRSPTMSINDAHSDTKQPSMKDQASVASSRPRRSASRRNSTSSSEDTADERDANGSSRGDTAKRRRLPRRASKQPQQQSHNSRRNIISRTSATSRSSSSSSSSASEENNTRRTRRSLRSRTASSRRKDDDASGSESSSTSSSSSSDRDPQPNRQLRQPEVGEGGKKRGKDARAGASSSSLGTDKQQSMNTSTVVRKRSGITYYVVEHDLVKPPYRRTRPRDDGETIGDAIFFGDDVMFGSLNEGADRLKVPWPERIKKRLVEEAGLRLVMAAHPGRTSRWNDEVLASAYGEWAKPEYFNGLRNFGTLFSSHTPLWVVIALGTNDLKARIREAAIAEANGKPLAPKALVATASTVQARRGTVPTTSSTVMPNHTTTTHAQKFSFRLDLSPLEREEDENEDDDGDFEFDADFIARSVGSIALQARRMFRGHCHEGTLRLLIVTPSPVRITPSAIRAGFDEVSIKISRSFGEAFANMGKDYDIKVVQPLSDASRLSDGVHLTDEAAEEVAERVWEAIASELPRRSKPTSRMDM